MEEKMEEVIVTNELMELVIPRACSIPHWRHEKNGVVLFAIPLEGGSYLVGTNKTIPVHVAEVDKLLEEVKKYLSILSHRERK